MIFWSRDDCVQQIMLSVTYLFFRYERYLKRAKTEDLTDIAALKCLFRTGTDKFGRPVIAFIGKLFPSSTVDLEKVNNNNEILFLTAIISMST